MKNDDKRKKIIGIVVMALFLIFMTVVGIVVGRPLMKFFSEPEKFREWVDGHGIWSRIAFIGMMVFQVIVALVPGEPLEIGAGYAFGYVEGTLLCIAGTVIGSVIVFVLVRKFGVKLLRIFFSDDKIHKLKFLQDSRKLNTLTFIILFIPGTPKDLLSYFVGLTDMKLSTWIIISAVARFPSQITSTVGGNALLEQNYKFAAIVFAVTAVISGVGLLIYNHICKRNSK